VIKAGTTDAECGYRLRECDSSLTAGKNYSFVVIGTPINEAADAKISNVFPFTHEKEAAATTTTPPKTATAPPANEPGIIRYGQDEFDLNDPDDWQAALELAEENTASGWDVYTEAWDLEFDVAYKKIKTPWANIQEVDAQNAKRYEDYWIRAGRLSNGVLDGVCILVGATGQEPSYNTTDYSKSINGNYKNGKLEGLVEINNGKSVRFVGYFASGLPNGIAYFKNGDIVIHGNFKNGQLNGFSYLSNDKEDVTYVGWFENDLMQGLGSAYYGDTHVWGYFEDSVLVEVIAVYEKTAEEKAAQQSVLNNALNNINAITNASQAQINQIYSDSQARVDKYRADLIRNQPKPQFDFAPSYGVLPGWTGISGY
jgi:hypothetical protein